MTPVLRLAQALGQLLGQLVLQNLEQAMRRALEDASRATVQGTADLPETREHWLSWLAESPRCGHGTGAHRACLAVRSLASHGWLDGVTLESLLMAAENAPCVHDAAADELVAQTSPAALRRALGRLVATLERRVEFERDPESLRQLRALRTLRDAAQPRAVHARQAGWALTTTA